MAHSGANRLKKKNQKRNNPQKGKKSEKAFSAEGQSVQDSGKLEISNEKSESKITHFAKCLTAVMGAFAAAYPIIKYIYNYHYQIECEKFYKIPGEYFSASVDSSIYYIALLVLFWGLPWLLQRHESKQKKTGGSLIGIVLFSFVFGVLLGVINVVNLTVILENQNSRIGEVVYTWVSEKLATVLLIMIVICVATAFFAMILPFCKTMSRKKVQNVLSTIMVILFAINMCLMLVGTHYILAMSPEDKVAYEIVTNKDDDYIVLGKKEDTILVVKYEIQNIGQQNLKQYILLTDEYWIWNTTDCAFAYINMDMVPQIEQQ